MRRLLFSLVVLLALYTPVHGSYHLVGCYSQVSFDSYYSSSFMEPTLCFRLCDTPVIYLQKTVCRCSGAGLMHWARQSNSQCTIPCAKPVDRAVDAGNTCGSATFYSAYAQAHFYSRHGHLFDYRISFRACELWNIPDAYQTSVAKFDSEITHSSLNRLEKCAAACLDQNSTTKSIAFNSDADQCLCITPSLTSRLFDRTHYVTVQANSSCDRYCNYTAEGARTNQKYQCGSLSNAKIWAIYDLNGSCPMNFVYVVELKKCVYSYRNFWSTCTAPAVGFKFDGNLTWPAFTKAIARLQLNESTVTVDFDDEVIINPAWKCPTSSNASISLSGSWRSYSSFSRSTLYGWSATTRYILENGCLQESSYSSYTHRYSYRLCVIDPVNEYSPDRSSVEIASGFLSGIIAQPPKTCPDEWFDLNGRCYRISEERKTIDEARVSCINVSSSTVAKNPNEPRIWLIDLQGNVKGPDELSQSPPGRLVEYVAEWQARLGFFLLDTDSDDSDVTEETTTSMYSSFYEDSLISSNVNDTISRGDVPLINEFHTSEIREMKNSTIDDDSCVLVTRTVLEDDERPVVKATRAANCSTPRHVLCETSTLIVPNFQYACFRRPATMDLPALISEQLTHELCLSICQELQTKLAVLNINTCYCLNGAAPHLVNVTVDWPKHRTKTCGDPCPGNPQEFCGDLNTVVTFQILESRRTFTYARTPAEAFPDFVHDSCIHWPSVNASVAYRFSIGNPDTLHPRHCLALCSQVNQKYALLNDEQCLCTNVPLKSDLDGVSVLDNNDCDQQCKGNFFYLCGNQRNRTVYSLYVNQPKCRHGFEVAENDKQCVYSHASVKTSSLVAARDYCQRIGGRLAKVNDVVEIQDILPDSILQTRLVQQLFTQYRVKFANAARLHWIDRTNDTVDPINVSERLLKQCAPTSDASDANCISIHYPPSNEQGTNDGDRCISQSDQCSVLTAMPACVDVHLEIATVEIPPVGDASAAQVTANISVDYTCIDGNSHDEDYHFIDDYCYRIAFHEVTWDKAKLECLADNARMFVPEKSVTLQHIKALFWREATYTSSGLAHVGVFYDLASQSTKQHDISNHRLVTTVPESNAVYDQCEKSFMDRNAIVMRAANLSVVERPRLKQKQVGCAYIDLTSTIVPAIHCNEIPCERIATVICQKPPTISSIIVNAQRRDIKSASEASSKPTPSEGPSSSDTSTDDGSFDSSTEKSSVTARDFAPFFSLLGIFSILLLLVGVKQIYQHRLWPVNRSMFRQRRPMNSVYSPLSAANEFDLN